MKFKKRQSQSIGMEINKKLAFWGGGMQGVGFEILTGKFAGKGSEGISVK